MKMNQDLLSELLRVRLNFWVSSYSTYLYLSRLRPLSYFSVSDYERLILISSSLESESESSTILDFFPFWPLFGWFLNFGFDIFYFGLPIGFDFDFDYTAL